jgi:hypothetical protein
MKLLRRLLKWLAYVTLLLGVLPLAFYAAYPDETLLPEVASLLEDRPSIPDAKNLYFALAGLAAKQGLSAHDAGLATYQEDVKLSQQSGLVDAQARERFLTPIAATHFEKLQCDFRKKDCVSYFQSHAGELALFESQQASAIKNYESLDVNQGFEDRSPLKPTSPLYSLDAVYLSRYRLAKLARDLATPSLRERVLVELSAEYALWDTVYRGSGVLIMQMIALSRLTEAIAFTSQAIRQYPELIVNHPERIALLAKPRVITPDQLRKGFRRETAWALAQAFNDDPLNTSILPGQSEWYRTLITYFFFKPNSTANYFYKNRTKELERLYAPAHQLAGHLEQQGAPVESDISFWIGMVKPNQFGRAITDLTAGSMGQYVVRAHELTANSQLLELQRQLYENRIARADVQSYLNAVPEALRNPFTLKPMVWNKSTAEISFQSGITGDQPRLGKLKVF